MARLGGSKELKERLGRGLQVGLGVGIRFLFLPILHSGVGALGSCWSIY